MKQYKHIDELRQAYNKKRKRIRQRLNEYKKVPRRQYFYELLYCLMTPQSNAVNAAKAQVQFEAVNFKNVDITPENILSNKNNYIRFHKTKARWILEMKERFPDIEQTILSNISASEKRAWLVANVLGFSFKEATHFLRNIGQNEGLAILDRHIIKNLHYYGVIRFIPKTITKKIYFQIEDKFHEFAFSIGIPTDELDLLFWSNETGEILK